VAWVRRGAAAALALAGTMGACALSRTTGTDGAGERVLDIVARRYAFDPPVIRVEQGELVRLRFSSQDVVHGFRLDGYDLDVAVEPLRHEVVVRRAGGPAETVEEVAFVADRPGKFRYRCSRTCGAMHPFMSGELIVGPNRLHAVVQATAVGLLLSGMAFAWVRSGREAGS